MINKKQIIIMLFLLVIMLLPNKDVYADDEGDTTAGENQGNDTQQWGEPEPITYQSGLAKYICEYKSAYSGSYALSIFAVDLNGKPLIENGKITNATLSGTWIGVNIHENSHSTWETSELKIKEERKKYTCNYTGSCKKYGSASYAGITRTECNNKPGSCSFTAAPKSTATKTPTPKKLPTRKYRRETAASYVDKKNNVQPLGAVMQDEYGTCTCTTGCTEYYTKTYKVTKQYYEEFTCPQTHPDDSSYTLSGDPEVETVAREAPVQLSTCQGKILAVAERTARSMVSNSKNEVTFLDTNDYKKLSTMTVSDSDSPVSCTGSYASGNCNADYYHKPSKVCIDVRTGLVYYNDNCDRKGSILLPDVSFGSRSYWHYFVPLNAKSDSRFFITVAQRTGSLDADICRDIMKKYSDYKDRIKPLDNSVYIGNYATSKENSSDYKKIASDGGCKISRTLNFNIDQKFYNEKDKIKTLNGYKFYFRQVDIMKPFNTTPDKNSLWYDWYERNKSNPVFDKSYYNVSYRADIINPNTIRSYNDSFNDPYTSWQNISLDGLSSFIREKGYVSVVDAGHIYKLGCGPKNEDWSGCK